MEKELLIFLTAAVGLMTAIVVGVVVVWREIRGVNREVKGVHTLINSRLDELLDLTRKSAHAEGVLEGQDRPSNRK